MKSVIKTECRFPTLKNSISSEETNAKQETLDNSTFETSKCLSANNLKQLHFCPADFRSQPRKSDSVGSASGKPVVKDLLNRALEISNVISKTSAIPEYKYIWQYVTFCDELVCFVFCFGLLLQSFFITGHVLLSSMLYKFLLFMQGCL